jgi:hypothetical protein
VNLFALYCSIPEKRPLPGKRPCGPKSRDIFKHPRALTRNTTVHVQCHIAGTLTLILDYYCRWWQEEKCGTFIG